jgi:hypothetical protein
MIGRMSSLKIVGDALAVRFTRAEKILGLVRDLTVPLSAVAAVEVVPDGLTATHGLRAPGLGLPGVRKVGTWRGHGGPTLVSVRADQPAVCVRLTGQRCAELLVGADDAVTLAASLTDALRASQENPDA